jgi:hypothetical protein
MTLEDRIQLIREAEAWFDTELVRCFDVYRLCRIMKVFIQTLDRIEAGVHMDLDELEALDGGDNIRKGDTD